MPSEIYLVKVGMTMTEGIVEEWYIADGDPVQSGELLYRLETEKVNLDVDADSSGTVRHLVNEGTVLEPGDVVGYIYAPGETIPAVLPTPPRRSDENADASASPSEPVPAPTSEVAAASSAKQAGERARPASSPVARKLAAELGIDLDAVTGTGPRGRITKEDVQRAVADGASRAPLTSASTPLRGIRKTIAQRMHSSLVNSAQLTMDMEVTMDDAVKLRSQLVTEWEGEGIRVGFTDLVMLAATKALVEHPGMNSALIDEQIVSHADVNMGMAVALDEGLLVPVIHQANQKDLKSMARESAALAERARGGSLGLDDMQGGTFTVTSLGMFGVDTFTPILNTPESGILGVGRLYDGVQWEGDTPLKRKCMRLSLTWDHRVIDGAPAAEFLTAVRSYLEAPYRLLL